MLCDAHLPLMISSRQGVTSGRPLLTPVNVLECACCRSLRHLNCEDSRVASGHAVMVAPVHAVSARQPVAVNTYKTRDTPTTTSRVDSSDEFTEKYQEFASNVQVSARMSRMPNRPLLRVHPALTAPRMPDFLFAEHEGHCCAADVHGMLLQPDGIMSNL